jgi:hypothetical protein
MFHRIRLLLAGVVVSLLCLSAEPVKRTSSQGEQRVEEELVTVVAEPKFYVSGAFAHDAGRGDELELFRKPDRDWMLEVDGFILEVVRPPEYAGRIIGMHHDGPLASGNPYKLWEVGRRYEFKIHKDFIGKLSFRICSLVWPRKVLPK